MPDAVPLASPPDPPAGRARPDGDGPLLSAHGRRPGHGPRPLRCPPPEGL